MKKRKRAYTLQARAERLAETRARITEAIMLLHGEVGPRKTTVTAIAERAGVERLTVYRHFANETEMFQACSHLYLQQNPPPQAGDWSEVQDPSKRARRGLEIIYGYFSRTESMFEKIYRDTPEFESLKQIMDGFDAYLCSLSEDIASVWPGKCQPRIQRILRHATKFATWQSLEMDGLSDAEKVSLMVDWLVCGGKSPD